MSQQTQQDQISKKRVVYTMPGIDAVTVRRNESYLGADGSTLALDLYDPPGFTRATRAPAVVFVTGFPDAGAERMLGCALKEMGSYVSWAQLAAASGMIGVTYTNREPAGDARAVVDHLVRNAEALGVDERRIGLWACSGNAPAALAALMHGGSQAACAALVCPYTLDAGESGHVADAARRWGFANPAAGKTVADLPPGIPLLVARAGRDQMPGLNAALDAFIAEGLSSNLPLTVINQPAAPHAFDLFDDSESSRETIRRILAFLQFHLSAR